MMPSILLQIKELHKDSFNLLIRNLEPSDKPICVVRNWLLVHVIPVNELPVYGVFDKG